MCYGCVCFLLSEASDKPMYIGKTVRHLIARDKEHNNREHSNIFAHLKNCNLHTNLLENFRVLTTARSDFELKIKESFYIRHFQPPLNIKSTSSNEYTLRLFS